GRQGHVRPGAHVERAGRDDPAGRAERAPGAADRRPRLRAADRARRDAGPRARPARRPGDPGSLHRQRGALMDTLKLVGELLLNGVLFGAMYGVAAIGLSLIFGTMRIIFIAQGTMIVLGGYAAYWLFKLLGVDPYVTLV